MSEKIMPYLTELKENNSREWYHAHKSQYQEANQEFEELIQELILEIGKVDGSILAQQAGLNVQLVRDTRSAMTSLLIIRLSGAISHPPGNCQYQSGTSCFLPQVAIHS